MKLKFEHRQTFSTRRTVRIIIQFHKGFARKLSHYMGIQLRLQRNPFQLVIAMQTVTRIVSLEIRFEIILLSTLITIEQNDLCDEINRKSSEETVNSEQLPYHTTSSFLSSR